MIMRSLETERKCNTEVALSYKSYKIKKSHRIWTKAVLLTLLIQTTFWRKGETKIIFVLYFFKVTIYLMSSKWDHFQEVILINILISF
jgi:hypothetical protein